MRTSESRPHASLCTRIRHRVTNVWASSGMTFAEAQAPMNQEFYRQVFNARARLGDAAIKAKAATVDVDARRTWLLLGDPTMRVK
ncbi:MAG TPA: C25 family cysteine peptidase [Blastocatellia bacterium]|nr:C25 family cysteine peptidase [Blastocatellia bacterium]